MLGGGGSQSSSKPGVTTRSQPSDLEVPCPSPTGSLTRSQTLPARKTRSELQKITIDNQMKAFLLLQKKKKREFYEWSESQFTSVQGFLNLLTFKAGDVVKVLSWRGKLVSLCML